MQMVLQELKKLLKKDGFSVVVCALFFGAIFVAWTSANNTYLGDQYKPSEYINTAKEVSKMSPDKAVECLQDDINSEIYEEGIYSPGKKDVLLEMKDVANYAKYLERIQSGSTSGLVEIGVNGFQERLQGKYKEIYCNLQADAVSFTASRGIKLFMQTDIIDAFISLLLLVLVLKIVVVEYESEMRCLLSCTINGTKSLSRAKWISGSIAVVICSAIILGIKLLIYVLSYGFTNWGGMIQSVSGYQGVSVQISIAKFLLVFIIFKLVGYWFLYTLFFVIALIIKNAIPVFIVEALFCGISLLMAYYIPVSSDLGALSLFSMERCVDQERLLAGYSPLNIFGYPIGYLTLWFVYLIVVLILLIVIISNTNSSAEPLFSNKRIKSIENIKRKKKCHKDILNTSLLYHEFKKSMWHERSAVCLMLGMLLVVIMYHTPEERISSANEFYYKEYIGVYNGKYTADKMAKIEQAHKKLKKLEKNVKEKGKFYTDTALSVANKELEKKDSVERLLKYGKYLSKYNKTSFVYEKGYMMLLGDNISGGYLKLCDTIGVILMVLVSTNLWGIEEWYGTNALCIATQCGMKKIDKCKIILNSVYAILIAMIVYIPWIYNVTCTYPMHEWKFSAASLQSFSMFAGISIAQLVFLSYILRGTYLFVIGITAKWIQKRMHSKVITVIATSILTLLPLIFFN